MHCVGSTFDSSTLCDFVSEETPEHPSDLQSLLNMGYERVPSHELHCVMTDLQPIHPVDIDPQPTQEGASSSSTQAPKLDPDPPGVLDALLPEGPTEPPDPGISRKTTEGWSVGIHPDDPSKPDRVHELVKKNQKTFAYQISDLSGYTGRVGPFHIAPPNASIEVLPTASGTLRRPRKRPLSEHEAMRKHLTPNYDVGFIVECPDAVIAHEAVVVAKRDANGGWTDARVCIDYGAATGGVNRYTPKDPYPLPLPDDLFSAVEGRCNFLSLCDARSGFFQIPIPEHLQHLTAFWWDKDGTGSKLYKWTRAPFGLSSMPSYFQRIMETSINDAGLSDFVKVYIDDILIHTSTYEEHLSVLQRVFDMFNAIGLKLHPGKSIFCASQVDFLGHNLSHSGKKPAAAKVAAIRALPTPVDVPSLRRLLGFVSFYREYTPRFTELACSLYQLLQKDAVWKWTPERDKDWQELKEELCKEGNALRRADHSKPFILHTDWSHHGLSAILNQMGDDGKEYLVACASRSCNKAESKYGSFRGELLAVVFGMRTFRYYLLGSPFTTTLYTDHKGLMWLMANKDLEGQYQRWQVILSAYDFTIKYKKGETHIVADVPSRFPMPTTVDNSGAREPDTVDRPVKVDISSLSPSEQEIALVELAEHNAVAACCLLARALSLSATPEWISHTSVDQSTLPAAYFTADASRDSEMFSMFDATTQANLDLLTHRAVQASPCVSMSGFLEGPFDSSFDEALDDFDFHMEERLIALQSLVAHQVESARLDLKMLFEQPAKSPYGSFSAPSELHLLSSTDADYELLSAQLHGRVAGIDSQAVPEKCLHATFCTGLTVVELFGGIASGLEMCLRNGIPVQRYIYCDKSDSVRSIAEFRLQELSVRYPSLLSPDAWKDAFTSLPQDVFSITPDHLIGAGCLDGTQWFFIAGFECQDLSPAGSGAGLAGLRSNSFYPLLQILGELQHLQRLHLPPLYIIENTSMQSTANVRRAVLDAYEEICERIGPSCLLDAARVGSYAHRLRNYWSNLCDPAELQLVLDSYERDQSLSLSDIIEYGRHAQICKQIHPDPWYCANIVGEPLLVLPTLVATIDSYSFRNGKSGMVIDSEGVLVPLTIEERELALGFPAGCTAAPGASYETRHKATGSAFDINALTFLLASALAIRSRNGVPHFFSSSATVSELGGGISSCASHSSEFQMDFDECPDLADLSKDSQELLHFAALAAIADGQDQVESPTGLSLDVWDDSELLTYIQSDRSAASSERVRKRAARFKWTDNKLYRCMDDGSLREVPPKADRYEAVRSLHESTGHWGRRRTAHLVMKTYWFPQLYKIVREVVNSCAACSRQQAVFNSTQPTLNSVPMKGYMYRWGVDLAGPFTTSLRGNSYFMVCIEHFSKYVEVFPLKDKLSKEVAYHFLHGVLSRYGACAEVLTDGGGEFQGSFAELLVKAMIDHRVTSRSHPQANGLAERCVKSIKACVQRLVDSSGDSQQWDEYLPWILMGYRATPQEATKVSPYRVLFGCDPVIPPSIMERLSEPLNFDDPEAVAVSILDRAKACEDAAIIAGRNILIAQHRDQLRYARLRSGGYLPSIVDFKVGQFVYVKDSADALHSTARPEILRVQDVRPSGVLVLVGRDGLTMVGNAINCAPCHLPIHIPEVPPLLLRPRHNHYCESCQLISDEHVMILCDSCNRGWHTYCLKPPLQAVPEGDWLCSGCLQAGVNLETLRTQRAQFQDIRDTHKAQRAGRLKNSSAKNKVPNLPISATVPRPQSSGPKPYDNKTQRLRSLSDLLNSHFSASTSAAPSSSPDESTVRLMHHLMPGEWPSVILNNLHIAMSQLQLDELQTGTVSRRQLSVLLHALDLSCSPSVISLARGHGSIQTLVMASHPKYHDNIGEFAIFYPCDPSSRLSYMRMCDIRAHVLIVSPCLATADVLVPLASSFARHVACFRLPISYLTDQVPGPREAWLSTMHNAGRLHLVPLPSHSAGTPLCWFLVFASRDSKNFLLCSSSWDNEISSLLSFYP